MNRLAIRLGEAISPVFLLAIAISAYEVVMRYLFNAPTIWVHESTVLLSAIAFCLSGLYSLARRDEICVTVFSDHFPAWMQAVRSLLTLVLGGAFLGAVAYGGWKGGWEALWGWHSTRTAFDSPTPAILKPLIVVSAALMLLQLLLRTLRRDG